MTIIWTVRLKRGKWELCVARLDKWKAIYRYNFKGCAVAAGHRAFPDGQYV